MNPDIEATELWKKIKSLIYFFVRTYIIHYQINGVTFKTKPLSGLEFIDTLKILADAEGKVVKIED